MKYLAIIAILLLFIPSAWATVPVVQSYQVLVGSTASARDSVAKPASLAAGDLVVLLLINADNTNGPCFTPPSDFNEIYEYGDNTEDAWVWAAYKVATASEPSYYVATSSCSSDEWVMWSLRITGQSATNFLNVVGAKSVENTTDSLTISAAITTKDSCLAFYLMAFDGGDGDPFSVKASTNTWTETTEGVSGTSTTSSVGGSWGTKIIYSPGSTGIAKIDCAVADGIVGGIFAIHGVSSTDTKTTGMSRGLYVEGGQETGSMRRGLYIEGATADQSRGEKILKGVLVSGKLIGGT